MSDRRRLSRRFLARPSLDVAPALLGRTLVRILPDGTRLSVRLVETEAYDEDDPASHSFSGPSTRAAVMFGPAGHMYVYFTYGMHFCMNVVTDRPGRGSAVLLRAAEPLEGLDLMAEHRGTADPKHLCSGPARLAQALAVDRSQDGADLVEGQHLWLERGRRVEATATGSRVGITRATERPWRFWVAGDPFVSRGRAGTPREGAVSRASPGRR